MIGGEEGKKIWKKKGESKKRGGRKESTEKRGVSPILGVEFGSDDIVSWWTSSAGAMAV